jgi:hypothetical protein
VFLNKEVTLFQCLIDTGRYLLARSVLKVDWRLAMMRGEVEGRMSRLLASLATNSTNYRLPFSQVNSEGGMRTSGRGGREGGLKKEPRG